MVKVIRADFRLTIVKTLLMKMKTGKYNIFETESALKIWEYSEIQGDRKHFLKSEYARVHLPIIYSVL